MGERMRLCGRLAASAVASDRAAANNAREAYGLLLCAHLPGGRADSSAHRLLSQMPPHMTLAPAGAAPGGEIPLPQGEEEPVEQTLNLPYDLLISREQAREDFEAYRLGKVPAPGDPDESICNAHLVLANRGYQGTAARQAFWREELARLAGRWVAVDVDVQRYSFRGTSSRGGPVQRVGTRLVLRGIEPLPGI